MRWRDMAGMGRRGWSRLGLVVPAVVGVAALVGCGGSDHESSDAAQAIPLTTITSPLSTVTTDPSSTSSTTSTPKATGGASKRSQDSGGSQRAPSAGPGGCPSGLTKRQCSELARHPAGPVGKAQNPQECLKTHTRAECKEIARAQNSGTGTVLTPQNCAQVLSQAQCEDLARAENR